MKKNIAIFLAFITLLTTSCFGVSSSVSEPSKNLIATLATPSAPTNLPIAINGYGEISAKTGRPKTVRVEGYTKKNGTYVQPHYRSPPRR